MNISGFYDRISQTFSKLENLKKQRDISAISSLKSEVLLELDDCIKIIKQSYESGKLDELKNLQGQIEILGEKWNECEISSIFQSVFDEKQQAIDEKIETIVSELAKSIFILENKSAPYLDEHRLLRGAPGDKKTDSVFQQWFISQAILYEKARDLKPETKRQINQMILQAYRKSAGFRDARDLKVQTSPLFPQQTGYYRHDQFEITKKCYDAYAADMRLEGQKLYLIESPLLQEVFNREMPHPELDLNIDHAQKFEALIDHLLNDIKLQKHLEYPVLADLTQLIAAQGLKPHELPQAIQKLEELLDEKAKDFAKSNGMDLEATRQKLISSIQLIAYLKHHEQDVLVLPKFFGMHSAWIDIDDMIGKTGFRISPAQTIEAWLKIATPEEIFRTEGIPIATLATKGSTIPKMFATWKDFIAHPLIKKFEAISTLPDAPLYQKILAKSTANLLKGLANCKVEQAYQEKKIEDLLQVAYYRMLNAMGEAILRKGDFIDFYNQIELIQQEIQSVLTLAAPYGNNELAESVIHNLTSGKSVIPLDVDRPKVHLKASAMHSTASVIASVEEQKGSGKLNVAVLKDSYFESTSLLEKARNYQLSVLDGDSLQDRIEEAFSKPPEGPIDLFMCEFHHNISLTRQSYHSEDIARQVKTMHQKGLLAEKCTIVIDTTINLDQSDEVRRFLADEEIHQMIKEGKLNVVLLHSAQKFDMLGFDNYYGGITTSINDHKSFNGFNRRMDREEDQLKGFNYQGLTHLQKYGDIDSYRKAIRENTRKLYGMLPKEAIYFKKMSSPMQISNSDEEQQVFIDVKFPNHPMTGYQVSRKLREFAKARKLPFTARASFGFANTNLSVINNDIFRLNPGLDDEKNLAQYAEFFQVVHEAISKKMPEISHNSLGQQDETLAKMINELKFPLLESKLGG